MTRGNVDCSTTTEWKLLKAFCCTCKYVEIYAQTKTSISLSPHDIIYYTFNSASCNMYDIIKFHIAGYNNLFPLYLENLSCAYAKFVFKEISYKFNRCIVLYLKIMYHSWIIFQYFRINWACTFHYELKHKLQKMHQAYPYDLLLDNLQRQI